MNKNSDILERITFFPKINLQIKLLAFVLLLSFSQVNANNNNSSEKTTTLLELNDVISKKEIVQKQVTGVVTDKAGLPLPNVNVIEKGTNNGTITDFDGNYTIEVSDDNAVLQFTYLGYKEMEVSVNGQTVINISLEEGNEALNEVVITAFGFEKKTKSVGYSITQLKGEELNRVKTGNPLQALRGKVAGVNISNGATGIKGSARVVIRGNSSFNGANQPLYIIDVFHYKTNS